MKHLHIIILATAALMIGIATYLAIMEAINPQPASRVMSYENAVTSTSTINDVSGEPGSKESDREAEGEIKPLPVPNEPVACTMDAKQCPDGSYVGRVAPDCAFAACPVVPDEKPVTGTACSEASKQVAACPDVYAPVCGLVQIQCITTPCDPIPETFSNVCNACASGNVISYEEGACGG